MTAIVGVVQDGEVWMGADSCTLDGDFTRTLCEPKIGRVGEFLFGCAGSMRTTQIMRYLFTPPDYEEGRDLMEYVIRDFMPALRSCFQENGGIETREGMDYLDGNILVAFRGRLFGIYQGSQVEEYREAFHVLGSGLLPASAALYALFRFDELSAPERIEIALEAAAAYMNGVHGPFHIEKL